MHDTFSLLQQLSEERAEPKQESPFPEGIKYQEYVVEVAGKDTVVFIPLRECVAFEETLSELTTIADNDDLRNILRKHRGIKK